MSLVGLGLVPTRMGEGGLSTEIPFLLAPSAPPPPLTGLRGRSLSLEAGPPGLGGGRERKLFLAWSQVGSTQVSRWCRCSCPCHTHTPPPLTRRKIHSPFWQPSPSPTCPWCPCRPVPSTCLQPDVPSGSEPVHPLLPSAAPALASLLPRSWPVRRPIHCVLGSALPVPSPVLFRAGPKSDCFTAAGKCQTQAAVKIVPRLWTRLVHLQGSWLPTEALWG